MRILAIDSSGVTATVAIACDDLLLAEYTINHKKTHSQTLLPMIDEMMKNIELKPEDIDAIAITGGPGSYTGLRIGSATAKGFALALDIPIINVPTMDAMAYNLYSSKDIICPIMDARRGQVYTGIYTFENGKLKVIMPQAIMMIDELCDTLSKLPGKVIFLGDATVSLKDRIEEFMKNEYETAPLSVNRSKAGSLAALAMEYYKEGKIESADEHKPDYLRLSQAERELKEKMETK